MSRLWHPQRPSVILISIDTLRADRLGCYGHGKPTSPTIDAFRKDAVLFEQSIAHAPSTLPSHASILTSLLPHRHRASVARRRALPDRIVTLTEALRGAGYRTASFNGHAQLAPIWGLGQGFEIYDSQPGDRFKERIKKTIAWLDDVGPREFFVFLHTYEVHHPYTPSPHHLDLMEEGYAGPLPREISVDLIQEINRGAVQIDAADAAHIVAAHDAEIRSVDEGIAFLLDALRSRDRYDDTIIVFTSDHGEEFGEHGVMATHSHSLYDELLRVPLIIKLPRHQKAGATVKELARGIDVAPTILGAVGVTAPGSFEGRDLFSGPVAAPSFAISQRDSPRPQHQVSAIRTAEWKLWDSRLFRLTTDPGERVDVAKDHPQIAEDLQSRLQAVLAERAVHDTRPVEPDSKTLEQLRALGYVE